MSERHRWAVAKYAFRRRCVRCGLIQYRGYLEPWPRAPRCQSETASRELSEIISEVSDE